MLKDDQEQASKAEIQAARTIRIENCIFSWIICFGVCLFVSGIILIIACGICLDHSCPIDSNAMIISGSVFMGIPLLAVTTPMLFICCKLMCADCIIPQIRTMFCLE